MPHIVGETIASQHSTADTGNLHTGCTQTVLNTPSLALQSVSNSHSVATRPAAADFTRLSAADS